MPSRDSTAPGYRDSFPKGALIGGALLLGCTLAFVATVRLDHIAPAGRVPSTTDAAISRNLKFFDGPDGEIIIKAQQKSGVYRQVEVLPAGKGAFLRSVMRGLAQARKFDGYGRKMPFKLSRLRDGRLILSDPDTGRNLYLRAFGPTNSAAFGVLLHKPSASAQTTAAASTGISS